MSLRTRAWMSIGVHGFTWTAGVALVLGAVFLFRAAGGAPWARTVAGLVLGVALIVAAERWLAGRYRLTTEALDAAGIGILYATCYAAFARSGLVPLAVAFVGMLAVTAAAVVLADRRETICIAVLGVVGGFVNAFLLSSADDYPLAVFAYLLALNLAIAGLAVRKGWWWLSALSVVLTALYEWGWTLQAVTVGLLPLAAAIFSVFAVVATAALWYRRPDDRPAWARWTAIAAAHIALVFAVYVAAQVNYGARYNVLFAYLLVVALGLLAIAWRYEPKWLHLAGGVGTLLTFAVWLYVSYTHAAWPWVVGWVAAFVVVYLVGVTPFAGLLLGVFIGVALREPQSWAGIVAAMLVLLAAVVVVAVRQEQPIVAALAVAMAGVAVMALHPPLPVVIALHAVLFAALLAVAWISGYHVLAVLAVPFYVAMVVTASGASPWAQSSVWALLTIGVVPYVLFVAYPLALGPRAGASLDPSIAAGLASAVMLVIAWMTRAALDAPHRWWPGLVPLAESGVLAVLLWRAARWEAGRRARVALLLSLTLAFFNVAAAMLLPGKWVVMLGAVEATGLVWIFTRTRYRVAALLPWATGLALVVFFRLAFESDLFARWAVYGVYLVCGLAMLAAAYLIRRDVPRLQEAFSVAGLFELWFLVNIEIANWFHSANGALNFDFATSQPSENVWYTLAWAVIATGLLIFGFVVIDWRAGRGAALALLVAAAFKAFLFDLPHLDGVYRAASLFGLGASLTVVGVALQKFWPSRSP